MTGRRILPPPTRFATSPTAQAKGREAAGAQPPRQPPPPPPSRFTAIQRKPVTTPRVIQRMKVETTPLASLYLEVGRCVDDVIHNGRHISFYIELTGTFQTRLGIAYGLKYSQTVRTQFKKKLINGNDYFEEIDNNWHDDGYTEKDARINDNVFFVHDNPGFDLRNNEYIEYKFSYYQTINGTRTPEREITFTGTIGNHQVTGSPVAAYVQIPAPQVNAADREIRFDADF